MIFIAIIQRLPLLVAIVTCVHRGGASRHDLGDSAVAVLGLFGGGGGLAQG